MADSSAIQPTDLLEAAMDRPFEPADVPLSPASPPIPSTSTSTPAPDPTPAPSAESSAAPTEEDNWQADYEAHVNEWRSQSASTRTQAELTRATWEAIRLREEEERKAHGQPPQTWDSLGDHITADSNAATEIVASSSVASLESIEHVQHEEEEEKQEQEQIEEQEVQHGKAEIGSPEHRWEHISSSQTSSYPSMSFPEASAPQSPSPQRAALSSVPASSEQQNPPLPHAPTRTAPSTIPSIMDNRVAPRTRTSLILSSLTINLLLPFINGVMLGFGEIFAKDVLLGWFGWKTHSGRTAANVGLRN